MKQKKAFTIIELLVFMAILSVLLLVLSQLFGSILNTRRESEANSQMSRDSSYILQRFMYDINRAQAINSPTVGGQGSTLQIQIDPSTIYNYRLNNGALELQINSGSFNRLNSIFSLVSNLNFQNVGNTAKISFTLTALTTKNTGVDVKNFNTTVGTR